MRVRFTKLKKDKLKKDTHHFDQEKESLPPKWWVSFFASL